MKEKSFYAGFRQTLFTGYGPPIAEEANSGLLNSFHVLKRFKVSSNSINIEIGT